MQRTSFGWSASYSDIETALLSRRGSFRKLLAEMDNFVPLSAAELEERDPGIRDKVRQSYPDISDEDIQKHVDFMAERLTQLYMRFGEIFRSEYIQIILLSHALCEGLINAILALGLAQNNSEAVFEVVEKASVLEKWVVCPKCFHAAYHFPKDRELYAGLKLLCKIRNDLVHGKIDLQTGQGEKLLKGSKPDFLPFPKDRVRANRFLDLPHDLLSCVHEQLPKFTYSMLAMANMKLQKYKDAGGL
jgi:hypothetical protein